MLSIKNNKNNSNRHLQQIKNRHKEACHRMIISRATFVLMMRLRGSLSRLLLLSIRARSLLPSFLVRSHHLLTRFPRPLQST